MSLQLMKERIKTTGITLYDEQIKDGQDILMNGFNDDISYNRNIVRYNSNELIQIKMYDQKYAATYGFTSQFLSSHITPVNLGDLLYDKKQNEYWLCVESYNVSNIHYEGKLGKCSRFIKWQERNGIVREIPVITRNATQYNNGEYKDEVITLGSDQVMIYTQLNDYTVKLDHGNRFFLDENKENPTVYILTKPDTVDYSYMGKGMLSLMLTETTYTPTKKELDLGICNYIDPTTLLPDLSSSNETTILNGVILGSENLKPGFTKTFIAKFTDKNNNSINWENIDFKWNILSNFTLEQKTYENKIDLCVDKNIAIGNIFILQLIFNDKVIFEKEITIIPIA